MLKIEFPMFSSQEMGSSLVSFQLIFEAIQSDIQIQVLFPGVENLESSGIQPKS